MQIEWLDTQAGKALLEQECQHAQHILDRVFGDQIVQIGQWGQSGALLAGARTQATITIDHSPGAGVDALGCAERLPLQSDSLDAVLLPHSLERSAEPHGVLREVHRVLRPDGKLIVLGFNPFSWWGVRHQVSLVGYPAGILRHISSHRLRDWLALLGMRVDILRPCYLRPARNPVRRALQSTGWCAHAYLLAATKETVPLTIVRPRLRRRPALVGSLVRPSARNARSVP